MQKIIRLDSVTSTNTYMATLPPDTPDGTVVTVRDQTCGRGQRGNSWEAAPGKNITLSILLRPEEVEARSQFMVSEAVALGVADTVMEFLGPDANVKVKWPNDIYVDDRKICGILIENTLCGRKIERSIAGIGLNVNQERFLSDAPNPVSMYMLSGREFPVCDVEEALCRNVLELTRGYLTPERFGHLHSRYCSMLWRGEGFFPYREAASGERLEAAVDSIAPTGHMTLRLTDGSLRTYAFKEVHAIL